nr:hypothetical protein [Tanacetum cinerariifolium]
MSSTSSAVTYTSVYIDSEPGRVFWGADEELSDGEDEHILLAEEQPLPPVVSPTAESLGYAAESDPEEDPKEYKDNGTDDGPVEYEVGESSTAKPTRGQGIDYGFVSTLDAEARRRGIGVVGYGIRDTWIDPAETVPEIAPMTIREVNTR